MPDENQLALASSAAIRAEEAPRTTRDRGLHRVAFDADGEVVARQPDMSGHLNPAEFVWTQVSDYTANTAPHNKTDLGRNVRAGIARTRHSQRRLRACIYASRLPWIR